MVIKIEAKDPISMESVPVKSELLGDRCDLSNNYVDVTKAGGSCPGSSGRNHQAPGTTRQAVCSACGTVFPVLRSKTTGGFSTIACPSCGAPAGYVGDGGACQWYTCGGSSCSSKGVCPTKRVIDECDLEIINDLICQLRAQLKDSNTSCYAFSAAELSAFLDVALSEFNGTPTFTGFTWKNIDLRRFRFIITEGATLLALGAQVLIESGREFTITDNGINFNPAQVSAALQNQFTARFTQYKNDLLFIKDHFRALPAAVLNYQSLLVNDGVLGNPSIARLRHLRQRRIF